MFTPKLSLKISKFKVKFSCKRSSLRLQILEKNETFLVIFKHCDKPQYLLRKLSQKSGYSRMYIMCVATYLFTPFFHSCTISSPQQSLPISLLLLLYTPYTNDDAVPFIDNKVVLKEEEKNHFHPTRPPFESTLMQNLNFLFKIFNFNEIYSNIEFEFSRQK